MTQDIHRGSAKIYQFPVRGRAGLVAGCDDAKPANSSATRFTKIASGSAWYHEEAIAQSARDDA